jgi:hypothetical protein
MRVSAKTLAPAARVPTAHPAKSPFGQRARSWVMAHKALASLLVVTAILTPLVAAAVIILQSVAVAPTTVAPDVTFLAGDDLAAMESLGFLAIDIGSSGTSVTVTDIQGISGATVEYTDVLELNNAHATRDYSVVLERSAALDARFSKFEVTIRDPSSGAFVWDALSDADGRSPAFILQDDGTAGDQLEIDLKVGIDDGLAAGLDLNDFALAFELTPV